MPRQNPIRWFVIFACLFAVRPAIAVELAAAWKESAASPATHTFEIRGTGGRNNPIRRPLNTPFSGDQLFARFRLRYAAESIDGPPRGDGEFFVLWLDASEGDDHSTHSSGVPNIGIHVNRGTNAFMIRFASAQERFSSKQLEGDREYLLVARIAKTTPGAAESYDSLALWVDPAPESESAPEALTRSAKGIRTLNWLGFATGRKTEIEDRIFLRDIAVAETWEAILGLPPKPEAPKPEPEPLPKTVGFKSDVHPILSEHCFECHAGEKVKGGVRLDQWDEAMNQTAPRDPDQSRLMEVLIESDPEKRMPPGKRRPLNPAEIKILRAWIAEGLEWDENLLPSPPPVTDHWAFQPVRRPAIPRVKNAPWVRSPIDAFVARKHEALGVNAAPAADEATLRRRIALDLTGLPPSSVPDADQTADLDEYIEHLLASPRYGERYARHWLDVARWADSNGHQHNRDRDYAWRYRDYVVRAFNHDKPLDEFVREQIAGDELPFAPGHIEATGFLAAARYSGNELDKEIQRNAILTDIVNTTGQAFLGLTFECAQCHTHKFDPISIRDYYRLQAFFTKGQPGNVVLEQGNAHARELIEQRWQLFDKVHDRIVSAKRRAGNPEPILVIPKSVFSAMKPDEKRTFDELETAIAKLPQAWAFHSPMGKGGELDIAPHPMRWPLPRDPKVLRQQRTHLLIRGDIGSKGPELEPGIPAVFQAAPAQDKTPRLALADWLTSDGNPLTARVWVNRIWQWHFGQGLVETSGDFGKQGTPPSHPELLDWLADELVRNGWSTKHIHRLILSSSTYRQSAAHSAGNSRLDPENSSLWRWRPRRLEAEAIRDSVLSTAGLLDTRAGGPSVPLAQGESSNRRGLYLQQKRNTLPHQQTLFDGAAAIAGCSRRQVSTVGLQPLYLLNSTFMTRAANAFQDRVQALASSPEAQARAAIELAFGRAAEADEIKQATNHIRTESLASLCLTLFNANEFLYIP